MCSEIAAKVASSGSATQKPAKKKLEKLVHIVKQEIEIARNLAGNDATKRHRQVRRLGKWLNLRAHSSFGLDDDSLLRIWKGLYYAMWMADKPLYQEEFAEDIAKLCLKFGGRTRLSIAFFYNFVRTISKEWVGIDTFRTNKFLMLMRRMLRYTFRALQSSGWAESDVAYFNRCMNKTLLAETIKAHGLTLHYLDIFFEELAKVANGNINTDQVDAFLRPFVQFLGMQRDGSLVSACRTRVFNHLLFQSELGRDYTDRYNAWKEMGFPKSINDLEKIEQEDDEVAEGGQGSEDGAALDPRAGKVDVFVPLLPFSADCVIDELNKLLRTSDFNVKRRKALGGVINTFEIYKKGQFPLGVKRMPKPCGEPTKRLIQEKVKERVALEEELYGVGRKLKMLNKSNRKKLLSKISSKASNETEFEQMLSKAVSQKAKRLSNLRQARLKLMHDWSVEEINGREADTLQVAVADLKPGDDNNVERESKSVSITHQKKLKKQISAVNGSGTSNSTPARSKNLAKATKELVTPAKEVLKPVDIITQAKNEDYNQIPTPKHPQPKKVDIKMVSDLTAQPTTPAKVETLNKIAKEKPLGADKTNADTPKKLKVKKEKPSATGENSGAAASSPAKLALKKLPRAETEPEVIDQAASTPSKAAGTPVSAKLKTKKQKLLSAAGEDSVSAAKSPAKLGPKKLQKTEAERQVVGQVVSSPSKAVATVAARQLVANGSCTPVAKPKKRVSIAEVFSTPKKVRHTLSGESTQTATQSNNLPVTQDAKFSLQCKAVKKIGVEGRGRRLSLPITQKKVKIVMSSNTEQSVAEYRKQVLSSPQIPHDPAKRPGKSLLKPNAMPGPISPFFR